MNYGDQHLDFTLISFIPPYIAITEHRKNEYHKEYYCLYTYIKDGDSGVIAILYPIQLDGGGRGRRSVRRGINLILHPHPLAHWSPPLSQYVVIFPASGPKCWRTRACFYMRRKTLALPISLTQCFINVRWQSDREHGSLLDGEKWRACEKPMFK